MVAVMWPALTFLLLATLVGVFLSWQRRWSLAQAQISQQQKALGDLETRLETAEQITRAQQQTLFNSMVEGVLLLDREGRIQLINQSLERQFGLASDIRGRTVLESFGSPELFALVDRLGKERYLLGSEIKLSGEDSRSLQVNGALVMDRDGQFQGSILVFHDVTRIRQLENTRREFVANVSHELRTPLSLIKGYLETLLEGENSDPMVTKRFLQTMHKHANRLHFLIEDLLTISQLESGQITLNRQIVELKGYVSHLLDDWQSSAAEKKIALENRLPEGLETKVDINRLEQVFSNLVENAIKYGRPKGSVVVSGRKLEGMVELCVSDDGPGIPVEALDRVFERFYRVDRVRSRDSGGTGLGLSIVKHIVQAHEGETWVESELGRGARFYFTLPTGRGEGPHPQP